MAALFTIRQEDPECYYTLLSSTDFDEYQGWNVMESCNLGLISLYQADLCNNNIEYFEDAPISRDFDGDVNLCIDV